MGPFYTITFFKGIALFKGFKTPNQQRIALLSFLFFSLQMATAQTFSVSGAVLSSEDNQPLIGVTVQEKGASNGAMTDFNGAFRISVASFLLC